MTPGFQYTPQMTAVQPAYTPPPTPTPPPPSTDGDGGSAGTIMGSGCLPIYSAAASRFYVKVSTQTQTFSIQPYAEVRDIPGNIIPTHFAEFAYEPGDSDKFQLFVDEHNKFIESLPPVFEMEFDDPDPDADEFFTEEDKEKDRPKRGGVDPMNPFSQFGAFNRAIAGLFVFSGSIPKA